MSVRPAYEAGRSQGYDLAQKGFELAFAPTPEAPKNHTRIDDMTFPWGFVGTTPV